MAEPRWQQMLRICLQRETAPPSRFMQLATLTPHGRPAVRTVVFRGWLPDAPPTITACTDLRSDKIPALRSFPYAEICWYFIVRVHFSFVSLLFQIISTHINNNMTLD